MVNITVTLSYGKSKGGRNEGLGARPSRKFFNITPLTLAINVIDAPLGTKMVFLNYRLRKLSAALETSLVNITP